MAQISKILSRKSAKRISVINDQEEKKRLLAKVEDENISYAQLLDWLKNEIESSTQMHSINHSFRAMREDAAYHLFNSIEDLIGVARLSSGKPSSDTVDTIMVTLPDGTTHEVPMGDMPLPNEFGEGAVVSLGYNYQTMEATITGQCQKRYRKYIDQVVAETKRRCRRQSIYSGAAMTLSAVSESSKYMKPEFMDLTGIDEMPIYLSQAAMYELEGIEIRITRPEDCKANGIEIKTGSLWEGVYGTGKTLQAKKTAKLAVDNNWTFIYCKDAQHVHKAMEIAGLLHESVNGVVLFTEDIDQVLKGERDKKIQDIVNTLDGIDTKGQNIISIFTTNHIEVIDPTFMRGKRIGSIVSFTPLDAETAKTFCEDQLDVKDDCSEVYKMIEDNEIAPAYMAEIIEKIRSHNVMRGDKPNTATASQLKAAVQSYMRQVEIARTKPKDKDKDVPTMFVQEIGKQVLNEMKAQDLI